MNQPLPDPLDDNPFTIDPPRAPALGEINIFQPDDGQLTEVPPFSSGISLNPVVRPPTPTPLDAAATADWAESQKRLGVALPTDGWLGLAVRSAIPTTSAPSEFHLAAGIAALATVLGNRVCWNNWRRDNYPHLWHLLIAPSGNWHKTTSIGHIEYLLERAGLDLRHASEGSQEAILTSFGKRPYGITIYNEFAGFLHNAQKDYARGLPVNLTELYDSPTEWRRNLKSGDVVIRRPAVSIFGTTTIDYFQELIRDSDIQSGFYYRFLFMTASKKNTERRLTVESDPAEENALIAGLRRVAALGNSSEGEAGGRRVKLTAAAEALWNAWVDDMDADMAKGHIPAYLGGFTQRLQTTTVKLAMTYNASAYAFDDGVDFYTIGEGVMASAVAYARLAWSNIQRFFVEDLAMTDEARMLKKVREAIGNGSDRSAILRQVRVKSRLLDDYLNTLVESDEAILHTMPTSGRPRHIYLPGPKNPRFSVKDTALMFDILRSRPG